jgi:hypothetical protein
MSFRADIVCENASPYGSGGWPGLFKASPVVVSAAHTSQRCLHCYTCIAIAMQTLLGKQL